MKYLKLSTIALLLLAFVPARMNAQKDPDATIKSLAPLVLEYHGQVQMQNTDLLRNITKAYEHNPRVLTAIAKMFYDAQDSAVAHNYEMRALKADPLYAQAYVLRGDANLNLYQDTVAAVDCYETATKIAPNNPSGYQSLINHYLKKRTSIDTLQATNVAELFIKSVTTDEGRMSAAEMNAKVGGDVTTSMELLEKISFDKMNETQLARYSYLLCSNNMTDKCQAVLDKALAEYPNNSYLYRVAMYNYAHAGSFDKAEEMGTILFEKLPEDSLVTEDYRIYSYCLTDRGETKKAVESLWKAIETTDPSWAVKQQVLSRIEEIYINDADNYIDRKQFDAAEGVYKTAIQDFFKHDEEYRAVQSYSYLGTMYTKTWADELEDSEKLVPYNRALKMYADMTRNCKDEDYQTSGLYRQCFMAYFINRIDANTSAEPYAKAFIDRVLSHDKMGYYDKNITTALQILAVSNPKLALSYAKKFQLKYPNFVDPNFDALVDKISK